MTSLHSNGTKTKTSTGTGCLCAPQILKPRSNMLAFEEQLGLVIRYIVYISIQAESSWWDLYLVERGGEEGCISDCLCLFCSFWKMGSPDWPRTHEPPAFASFSKSYLCEPPQQAWLSVSISKHASRKGYVTTQQENKILSLQHWDTQDDAQLSS